MFSWLRANWGTAVSFRRLLADRRGANDYRTHGRDLHGASSERIQFYKTDVFRLSGAHFGPPGYETDLLYIASILALCGGGAGPLSLDGYLSNYKSTLIACTVADWHKDIVFQTIVIVLARRVRFVNDLTIRDVKARAVIAPLKRPVRTAVGTIPSAPLVLIDVLTEQGSAGRSYIFAYTPVALVPLVRLIEEIAAELKGKAVSPFVRMREFDRRFRLVGWQGLIGMAVSGLDMAFWDVIARTLDQPPGRCWAADQPASRLRQLWHDRS